MPVHHRDMALLSDGKRAQRAAIAAPVGMAAKQIGLMQILGCRVTTTVINALKQGMDDFLRCPLVYPKSYHQPAFDCVFHEFKLPTVSWEVHLRCRWDVGFSTQACRDRIAMGQMTLCKPWND